MKHFVLLSLLTVALFVFTRAQPDLSLQEFASGLDRPVAIDHAGDGRLFVVEQKGVIWELDENGTRSSTAFLNIEEKVNSTGNEQGLLGLAFSPDFAEDGRFYLNYTMGPTSGSSVVARYKIDIESGKGDEASEEILLEFDQPAWNHNGGDLHFGKDGFLYISSGDGGGADDPNNNAQNKLNYLGKILRIDVSPAVGYTVPSTNPFVNDPSGLDEIWAMGLRNPWRFSFDRLRGDLWIGDVGQNSFEEVNYLPHPLQAGANFGWRCYEADSEFNQSNCGSKEEYTFPVFKYGRSQGFSVTGGYVYRGNEQDHFQGNYVFADYVFGRFWIISPRGEEWFTKQYENFLTDVSAFGENKDGELFVAELDNGNIYKLLAECENDSLTQPNITVTTGSNSLCASTDDLRVNAYQWYLNGDPIEGARGECYEIVEDGEYQVETIFNNDGCIYRSLSDGMSLIVGLKDRLLNRKIQIYPNPNEGFFQLSADTRLDRIDLYSIDGQWLESISLDNNNKFDLDLSNYNKGLYLLKVTAEGKSKYVKWLKIH